MSIVLELTEQEEAALKRRAEAEGADFQSFLRRTLGLDADVPLSSWTDAALLSAIGVGFDEAFWARLTALSARRADETLTGEERSELIALADVLESRDAYRLTLLGELGRRRNQGIPELMAELGLKPRRLS